MADDLVPPVWFSSHLARTDPGEERKGGPLVVANALCPGIAGELDGQLLGLGADECELMARVQQLAVEQLRQTASKRRRVLEEELKLLQAQSKD